MAEEKQNQGENQEEIGKSDVSVNSDVLLNSDFSTHFVT